MNLFFGLVLIIVLAALAWRLWPGGPARLFQTLERRRGRLRSCRVRIGEREWHYLEGGHGEPLVLLHGFNADADHFCRVARHLVGHFRILAPDLPGFGETGGSDHAHFRIEDQAEAVMTWMDRLEIRACYMGGSSMGGYIASAIAQTHPDRVRALWLLAPGGVRSVEPSPLFQEIEEDRHNPLIVRNDADFQRLMDFCFVHPPWIPRALKRHLARRAARRSVQHQRAFDAIRFDSRPLEEMVEGLNTPALIVWGRADQVLNPAGAAILERRMGAAEVLMLPATGHLPMLENPRMVAEAWLAYTEGRAREAPTA